MYNFSGIYFRIWGVCGILFFLGILIILFNLPTKNSFKRKDFITGTAITCFSACMALLLFSRILFPKVLSYHGEYVDFHRDSAIAPPLPVTYEYIFWNGDGKKKGFYLDIFSKKTIYPEEFKKGIVYTIYYDTLTNIIVKVVP